MDFTRKHLLKGLPIILEKPETKCLCAQIATQFGRYSPSLVLVVPSTAPDTPVSSSANANNTALCLLVKFLREKMTKI